LAGHNSIARDKILYFEGININLIKAIFKKKWLAPFLGAKQFLPLRNLNKKTARRYPF